MGICPEWISFVLQTVSNFYCFIARFCFVLRFFPVKSNFMVCYLVEKIETTFSTVDLNFCTRWKIIHLRFTISHCLHDKNLWFVACDFYHFSRCFHCTRTHSVSILPRQLSKRRKCFSLHASHRKACELCRRGFLCVVLSLFFFQAWLNSSCLKKNPEPWFLWNLANSFSSASDVLSCFQIRKWQLWMCIKLKNNNNHERLNRKRNLCEFLVRIFLVQEKSECLMCFSLEFTEFEI